MAEDIMFDKDKLEAALKRMIDAKPTTFQEAVAKPKLNKDGSPRKKRFVQKMDKTAPPAKD